jgi:NAD dependent epimerase/dehydratase family enzyme
MTTLLLDGQNAVPELAQRFGYKYRFAALEGALAQLAERPRPGCVQDAAQV